MKKILFITLLAFNIYFARGQRFFYQRNNTAGSILREGLTKSAQFVTETPLASDYIIKTDIGFKSEPNTLTLQIILEELNHFQNNLSDK